MGLLRSSRDERYVFAFAGGGDWNSLTIVDAFVGGGSVNSNFIVEPAGIVIVVNFWPLLRPLSS